MEKDFTDFIAEGVVLMEKRDRNSWELGDLACEFEITVGRPSESDAPTLSDLANGWNASTQRVSEWRNCSSFYPTHVRTFHTLTWSHYNKARRASNNCLDNALELMEHAASQAMGTRAFERYLKGIYFEGFVQAGTLPEAIKYVLPRGAAQVWVTVKREEA